MFKYGWRNSYLALEAYYVYSSTSSKLWSKQRWGTQWVTEGEGVTVTRAALPPSECGAGWTHRDDKIKKTPVWAQASQALRVCSTSLHPGHSADLFTSDSEIPVPLSVGFQAPREVLLCYQVENYCYSKLRTEVWPSRMSIRTEKTKGSWKIAWAGNQYFFFWTHRKSFSLTNSCFKRKEKAKKAFSL